MGLVARINGQTLARKPLRESNYQLVDQARVQVNYVFLGQFRVHECLVYGKNAVQTQSGSRPIESIQVGDLVLSQNVESGELCLKPVIKTTIRPPMLTLCMVTEAGEIQATAGHRWFVSSKGWLMTKELQPDMLLHNASGPPNRKHDCRSARTVDVQSGGRRVPYLFRRS